MSTPNTPGTPNTGGRPTGAKKTAKGTAPGGAKPRRKKASSNGSVQRMDGRGVDPGRIRKKTADGVAMSLADLPLVAYGMSCNHLGRDYGVKRGDYVYCPACGTSRRVAKILAQ